MGKYRQKMISVMLWGLSPFISLLQKIIYREVDNGPSCYGSPVFIVGAPRTGSTVLYQALTNCYDVVFIDNLAAKFYRNLRFGIWLSHKRFAGTVHNNFLAEFGDTGRYGGHAPSECGEFWYRWLPRSDHYAEAGDVTEKEKQDIKSEIVMPSNKFGAPFLFKNLNAGQRLGLVSEIFPDARIIYVRRDPVFVARSILNAREKLGISKNQWWSIKPKNYRDLIGLPEVDMCASQVIFIERQIEADLSLFPPENVFTLDYNDMSEGLVDDLAERLGLTKKSEAECPKFRRDDRSALDSVERDVLESALNNVLSNKESCLD